MEFLLIFKSSVLPIFLIIGTAIVYNRLFHPNLREIAILAVTVFAPILVFQSLIKENITVHMLWKPILFMGGLTLALMIVATLVAKALKADDDERISLILASSMINVGNFGLPLIYFTYGNGASAVSILYFVAFNIPLGTTAIYLTSRERSIGPIVKDIMKIPIFHALVLAVIMSQFRIPVPAMIEKSLELMGQAAIPLLIFVLGLQLANIHFERRFIKFIIPSVLIRLVLSPLIALALFHFLGVSGFERNVAVVQTSAPAAILPLMYAIRFNRAPDLLAATILATTLLSGLSLTVLIHYLPYIP